MLNATKNNLLADRLQEKHMMRIVFVTRCSSKRWQQFGNISDTRRNKRKFTHQTQATVNIKRIVHCVSK